MEERVELGRVEEILRFLVHIEADPVRKGLLIKELHERHGMKLVEISRRTNWSLPWISELYRVARELIPELLERVLRGELKATVGVELSKLPPDVQRRFIEVDRITIKMVEEERRKLALSPEVLEVIDSDIWLPPEAKPPEEELVTCPYCGRRFRPGRE